MRDDAAYTRDRVREYTATYIQHCHSMTPARRYYTRLMPP